MADVLYLTIDEADADTPVQVRSVRTDEVIGRYSEEYRELAQYIVRVANSEAVSL